MKNYSFYLLFLLMTAFRSLGQPAIEWTELPDLPGGKGWAGMYAGVIHSKLIVMGGANFPDKYPWEGGKKKWSDEIYVFEEGKSWRKLPEKLPVPAAYGVSVSYKNKIVLVGGSNEDGHLSRVMSIEWDGKKLKTANYPELPMPLANTAGQPVGDLIVVFGGMMSPTGTALKKCLALDMNELSKGWFEIDPWPGSERFFPVCAYYKGKSYLFGGETTAVNMQGNSYRSILLDCYSLALSKENGRWIAEWKKLATMPRGMTAGGTILPVLNNDRFLFWGGVDAVTASYRTPATHPEIIQSILYYYPATDSWEYIGEQKKIPARVTLPVVYWRDQWWYISGELRPGVRTPKVTGVK
jgi:N-acetylneuraminate epimerase